MLHGANRHLRMVMLKLVRFQQTNKMHRRRNRHRDMEELMGRAE